MDCDALLELTSEVGYRLLESGAEIYRVEESIRRMLEAYGLPGAEVFAIPNCIIASVVTPEGKTLTRVRRMPSHGTDLDRLETYNDMSRTICRTTPEPEEFRRILAGAELGRKPYSMPVQLLAYFLGAAAFSLFFGGSWRDGLCAGACGVAIGLGLRFLTGLKANPFFRTFLCAALSALIALGLTWVGIGQSVDCITIGALMALVPGVAITNAMREIMGGDLVAGLSRTADAVLTATAIALGTGAVMSLAGTAAAAPETETVLALLPCVYAFFACLGFCPVFNIRSVTGMVICCCGGALGWLVYLATAPFAQSAVIQSFFAAVTIAIYSEIVARIRKCPVTSYLLVALYPLVPGGGIYYTMAACIRGETQQFLESLLHTFGIAGALAVGAVLVSSTVRLWSGKHTERKGPRCK